MNKKQKIIVSITGIFLVFLILVGLTYAYYLSNIKGNTTTKSISVDTANLELTYSDGSGLIEVSNVVPGQNIASKTFTVTNSGNATIYGYGVYLQSVVNTFSRKSDIVYTLTCTSSVSGKTCNGVSETTFPSSETLMVSNNINASEVQSYTLTVTYKNLTTVDQSEDMDKEISAKVNISASQTNSKSLYEMLLLVNGTPTVERSNFNKIYTENTASDHGFYKTTENGTNVYYFAGTEKDQTGCYGVDTGDYYSDITTEADCSSDVQTSLSESVEWYQKATIDNWVKFGKVGNQDIYWRVLRTDEKGNVKLLYHGTSVNATDSYIDSSKYYDDSSYVTYKGSKIENVVNNWVATNLFDHFNQISSTSSYCNETTTGSTSISLTNVYNSFAVYDRFGDDSFTAKSDISPTLNCTGTNVLSNTSYGLVTVDELSYAGGSPGKKSTNLWYYRNAVGTSSVGDNYWYTMSPIVYTSSNNYVSIIDGSSTNSAEFLNSNFVENGVVTTSNKVRPVITINSNAKVISGDGTSSNPYVISNSDTNKICNPITVATSGSYTVGDEYSCLVDPDHTPYNFYVISSDSSNVTMIMDSNICSNGQSSESTLNCPVAWTDATDYSKGPNLALNYLNTATSGWTNLKNINVTHEDESTASTKSIDITFSGKSRFLYLSELKTLNNNGYLNILKNNLNSTVQRYYLADTGYNSSKNIYNVYSVAYNSSTTSGTTGSGINNTANIGVRPVIVVPKSKFSN